MPLYESVFIARQDISASQVDSLADQFTGLIQAGGGEVKKREYWGLRNLAYRIKKNRKGHYILFNIEAPPAAVAEMERNMSINEDVIRYLTVRVDELETEQSAMMRSRGSRDERGGRRPGGGRFHGDGGGRFHGDGGGPRGGRGFRDGDRGDRGERGGERGGERRSGDGESRSASEGDSE